MDVTDDDYTMMLGELYVSRRLMQEELGKTREQVAALQMEVASLNTRIDQYEADNEEQHEEEQHEHHERDAA